MCLAVDGGLIVQILLLPRSLRQRILDSLAFTGWVNGRAVKAHHIFLHAPQQIALFLGRGQSAKGLSAGKQLWLQQPPQKIVGIVLAHVGRGRHQQQVAVLPGDLLRHLVAARLVYRQVRVKSGTQLVGLVKDDQVVRRRCQVRFAHPVAPQRVHTDDGQVAAWVGERVAVLGIGAREDAKAQAEEIAQLALPVAHQAGGRDDEHPLDEPAQQHLADDQAGHDRLARAGIVGQQEAKPGMIQQAGPSARRFGRAWHAIDGSQLVGQQVNQRGLGGEQGIEQVGVFQPVRLGHQANDLGSCPVGRPLRRKDLKAAFHFV